VSAYTDAFWTRVMALAQSLDTMSYYHLLGVEQTATREEVEAAYYRRAKTMHPDRHAYQTDPTCTRALVRLYARFGEGFRVLRSAELRPLYDQELAAGRVRLSADAQHQRRIEESGPDPRAPHVRILFDKARALLDREDVTGARAQLQLAAQFEPDSKAVQRELDRCQALAAENDG